MIPSPSWQSLVLRRQVGAWMRWLRLFLLFALFSFFFGIVATPYGQNSALAYTPDERGAYQQTTEALFQTADWASIESDSTLTVAWGDVDNDGDLDLAVGNWRGPVRLYRNDGQTLSATAVWSSSETTSEARSIAWGDVDNDGDLDLAVGNDSTTPNRLYRNEGGTLSASAIWSSAEADSTYSVAWGDIDRDGDLDLVVGNWANQNRIYLNTNGDLSPTAGWASDEIDETTSLALGDVDNDGDLDLVTGTHHGPNRLYRNEGSLPTTSAIWSSSEFSTTWGVALGDVNGDGLLDLAVANEGIPSQLYLNQGAALFTTPAWRSPLDPALSLAWGDVDGDSDLDLAVGTRRGTPNRLYRNENGLLGATPFWSSENSEEARSIAWGDVDNDGDLDLALGNDFGDPNRLYRNQSVALVATVGWSANEVDGVLTVAWGDVDGDGDLDLAVGTVDGSPSRLYRNDGGALTATAVWSSAETDETRGLAWGDVDGDGDLDLAVGNDYAIPNRLYRNDGGALTTAAVWSSAEAESTLSVAWGDADGDGDLDLAVGNWQAPNRLYRNEGGVLTPAAVWSSVEADETLSVAWGDVDGDGDLDLAAGNWNAANRLYLNGPTGLAPIASWSSAEADETTSVAWGDVDNDGDLDLAVGNRNSPNRLYLNEQGRLTSSAVWSSNESDSTFSIAWGDADGDGDLDLVAGNGIYEFETMQNLGVVNRLYRNEGGMLRRAAVWSSTNADATWGVAWGDVDGDGDLDLAAGNRDKGVQLYLNQRGFQSTFPDAAAIRLGALQSTAGVSASANFYATARIHSAGRVIIPYTIYLPQRPDPYTLAFTYSLDGGSHWQRAVGAQPPVAHQQLSINRQTGTIIQGQYDWDVYSSAFYGQSDNVVVRLALTWRCHNSCTRSALATQSWPIRVRGTQVYVQQTVNNSGQPVADALLYRLPKGQNRGAQALQDVNGNPLVTNQQGFLQGRGALAVGDYLFALAPVVKSEKYTVYLTSARPTATGFVTTTNTVNGAGIQTLTVAPANPLILFDLTISLEWDARADSAYLAQLKARLKRASELLYDWSNGQAALGHLTIYHKQEAWQEADIRIYANNQLRPHATIGGIVRTLTLDTFTLPTSGGNQLVSHLYQPGHVAMGAVWNRYGERGEQLSQDWERTLAHELGHYLFYLHDNYVGLDADNQIIRVEGCPGVMSNPYIELDSEFHPAIGWGERCAATFSQRLLGRHDWATIRHHYHWLYEPGGPIDDAADVGPNGLPLEVTQIHDVEPAAAATLIPVPSFTVQQADGARYQAGRQAQAYLFQQPGDHLVNLGAPQDNSILARGAHPGDLLCIYDAGHRLPAGAPAPLTGCQVVQSDGAAIKVSTPEGGWQPEVIITPQSAQTLTVSVSNIAATLSLEAQFYSQDGAPLLTQPQRLTQQNNLYTATIVLPRPYHEAYLHIRQSDNWSRGVIINYTLAGAPILVLGEGNTVTFGNNSALHTSDGSTTPLPPGTSMTLQRGRVQIRQTDGKIQLINEGDTKPLNKDDYVLRGSRVLTLETSGVLAIKNGEVTIRHKDNNLFTLETGDILKIGQETAIVLPDETLRAVLWFLDGGARPMSEGDVLRLGGGDTITIGPGDARPMSEGDILRVAAGEVLVFADSEIPLASGGNASYVGDGDAPVRSSDGRVTLYGRTIHFKQGEFYTVQAAATLPQAPLWATAVGQGYRVTATPGAPNLTGLSISMSYIGRAIDPDKEHLLTIYYWATNPTLSPGQQRWQPLPSKVDVDHNLVTAKAAGEGIYLLMYSFDVTIPGDGWSWFPYPVLGSRPITPALSSIDPDYQMVYHYDVLASDPFTRWRVFAKAPVPIWVNTLLTLDFGQVYLIHATHTSTLTIKFADESVGREQTADPPSPPATYYGYLATGAAFTPRVGMTVNAYVGATHCGVGQTVDAENGAVGYRVIVYGAAVTGEFTPCGAPGRVVHITINGQTIVANQPWNNVVINRVDYSQGGNHRLYLALVRK